LKNKKGKTGHSEKRLINSTGNIAACFLTASFNIDFQNTV